jgi:hypothetical protein
LIPHMQINGPVMRQLRHYPMNFLCWADPAWKAEANAVHLRGYREENRRL